MHPQVRALLDAEGAGGSGSLEPPDLAAKRAAYLQTAIELGGAAGQAALGRSAGVGPAAAGAASSGAGAAAESLTAFSTILDDPATGATLSPAVGNIGGAGAGAARGPSPRAGRGLSRAARKPAVLADDLSPLSPLDLRVLSPVV